MSEKRTDAPEARRLMIAAPLSSVAVREVLPKLPPHVTIIPWFDLSRSDWGEFDAAMCELTAEEDFSHIFGGESACFGEACDVRVRKLAGVLFGVHAHALGVVHSFGCEVDPQFTGINWAPHVTNTDHYEVAEGEALDLQQIAVFSKDPEDRVKRVEAVYVKGCVS